MLTLGLFKNKEGRLIMDNPINWTRVEDIPAEIIEEYGSQIPWNRSDTMIVNWVVVVLGLSTQQEVYALVNRKSDHALISPSGMPRTSWGLACYPFYQAGDCGPRRIFLKSN